MKLMSVPEQGKPAAKRNFTVFWIIGFIVCYQTVYQIYMTSVLHHDVAPQDPWCDDSANTKQQCIEAQLFRGWEHADSHLPETRNKLEAKKLEASLQPHGDVSAGNFTGSHNASKPNQLTSSVEASTPVQKVATVPAGAMQSGSSRQRDQTPLAKSLIALQERFEEGMRKRRNQRAAKLHVRSVRRHKRHVRAAEAVVKEWRKMSMLGRDLQALQNRFEARLVQGRASTQKAKTNWSNLTAWAQDVHALQQHFEGQSFSHSRQVQFPVVMTSDNSTAWSRDLVSLQRQMEARMDVHKKAHAALEAKEHTRRTRVPLIDRITSLARELCTDPQRQRYQACAQFVITSTPLHSVGDSRAPVDLQRRKRSGLDKEEAQLDAELHQIALNQQSWEKKFVEKVHAVRGELCSDPRRRKESACKQLVPASESISHEFNKRKKAWHQQFAVKIKNVGRELCSNPMRRGYLICKQFFHNDTQNSSPSRILSEPSISDVVDKPKIEDLPARSARRILLNWGAVTAWQAALPKGLRGASAKDASMAASDISKLRTYAHWSGRIPSVACVTLVPKGSLAKAWLQYFVNNFRMQKYEGMHQLILVHHHTDSEIGELIRKYADGSYIRSAVARGFEFPSATAFRFGAWLARDADIVARWDFEAWHHPHRLSTQVRALAFSGRPACLLASCTVYNKSGANTTTVDGKHWDSSLVGEAAWMRKNWYPHMEEADAVFGATASREVVKIDMPNLEVFDDAVF